jgi:hypothetical protein
METLWGDEEAARPENGGSRVRFGEKPATEIYIILVAGFFLSASDSARFHMPVQAMSIRPILTGKLTREPVDNHRFSTTTIEVEK